MGSEDVVQYEPLRETIMSSNVNLGVRKSDMVLRNSLEMAAVVAV